jgi:hypothetical protein
LTTCRAPTEGFRVYISFPSSELSLGANPWASPQPSLASPDAQPSPLRTSTRPAEIELRPLDVVSSWRTAIRLRHQFALLARRWYDEARSRPPWPHGQLSLARSIARRDLDHPFLVASEVDSVYTWWRRGASAFGDSLQRTRQLVERALWRRVPPISRVLPTSLAKF